MANETTTKRSTIAIKWAINIVLPLIVLLIPTSDTYTLPIKTFLAITVFAIALIATENIPMGATALLLPVAYIVILKVPAATAFAGWAMEVPWLVIAGFLLTAAMEKSGLLKRLAFKSIVLFGGKFSSILYGLVFFGMVVSLVIADVAAKAVLIGALALSICHALELPLGSRSSSSIGLAALMAIVGPSGLYYTGSTETIVPLGIAQGLGVVIPTWLEYIQHMFIPQMIYIIICCLVIQLFFKPDAEFKDTDFFARESEAMGKIKTDEKKLIVIAIALIVAILTTSIHGISVGWVFVIAASIMFIPGIAVASMDDFKKVNLPFILFITACLSIGFTSGYLGVGKFISDLVYPYIAGGNVQTTVGIWLLGFVSNFALTPMAAFSGFTEPIVSLVNSVGMNPLPALYAFVNSLTNVVFPYESAPYLIIFSFEMITFKQFTKFCAIKSGIALLCILAIFIPYWTLIGLF